MNSPQAVGDVTFEYRARDLTGGRRKGKLAARDREDAEQKLRAEGLYPIEVVPAQTGEAQKRKTKRVSKGPLSQRRKAEFIGRLAKLTGGRISVERALTIIAQGQDGALSERASALRVHLREGKNLVDGLQSEVGITDVATLSLVRGAEVSGNMPEALATAAEILEQRVKLSRSIATGMLYPTLLLFIAFVSVGLIMIAIIPQFRPLVEERMDMVPFLGQIVFAVSGTLSTIWPILLTAFVALAFALWILHRRGRALPILRRVVSAIPFVRRFLDHNQMIITLHVLGALLKSDVAMSEALHVVTGSATSGKDTLQRITKSVENGENLSSAFAKNADLPSSAVEMLRIGEETGDLAAMTTRAATEMRETVDRALERFLTLFQPALIVFVGLLVGVSLYALFSAIVSVNSISF